MSTVFISLFGWADRLIDRITMYRLLVYYLLAILGTAMVLGAVGKLAYSPMEIAMSAAYITLICWISHKVFEHVFEAPTNPESTLITGFILALIVAPATMPKDYVFLTAVSGLAVASKYLLAVGKKHIFNPAAVAVALTAAGAGDTANWWVGTALLAPVVVTGGVLIVRKIKRGHMVVSFMAAALVATAGFSMLSGGDVVSTVIKTISHSSLLFLGFVMLTEPLTSPGTLEGQRWYAVLVGVLFAPQVHIGSLYSTPELALVSGNILAFLVSPRAKFVASVAEVKRWGSSVQDFIFDTGQFRFKPGQYMEFTLPHSDADARGYRRYFTIASSPTEQHLRIGVKFYPKGSSFKTAMLKMNRDAVMGIAGLAGDFVMPKDTSRKLAFIAGGIGVTPFRSMVKYLIDTGQRRDVVMMYAERKLSDLAYVDVFNEAQHTPGLRIVYTLSAEAAVPPGFLRGSISTEAIRREIPDYLERQFYISGPHSMVAAMQQQLSSLGVSDRQIKTDFFPGYA